MLTIVGDLHGVNEMLWVITIYIHVSTIMLPIYGKLGDLIGRKGLLIGAISIVIVGSIIGMGGGTVLAALLFVWVGHPIISLHLFKDSSFNLTRAVGLITGIAIFGTFAYLPAWLICVYLELMGIRLGTSMQILVLIVQNQFPNSQVGMAAASNNHFRQNGASLGSAVVGSLFAHHGGHPH